MSVQKHWDWKPIETAPKDGTEILIALPGGHSDHFHVVFWKDDAWNHRFSLLRITEAAIQHCDARPSWVELDDPPGSLCRDDEAAPTNAEEQRCTHCRQSDPPHLDRECNSTRMR